jgi:RNA polymerase sigma-70 factor (ECF subfamily)
MGEFVGDDRSDRADPALMGADRVWIRAALKALPDSQREAILLAYFGGYTYAQIAEHKGLPLGTVKGHLRLGLQKLAAMDKAPSAQASR